MEERAQFGSPAGVNGLLLLSSPSRRRQIRHSWSTSSVPGAPLIPHELDTFAAAALAGLPHAVVVTDLAGLVLFWNVAAEELYGYGAAEATGRSLAELILPAGAVVLAGEQRAHISSGQPYSGDWTVQDRSGRIFRAHVSSTVLRDAVGHPVAMVNLSTDVSEGRAVEQALAASERRYRARFEQVGLAQAVFDLDLRCTQANDALYAMLGVRQEDLLGRTMDHLHHPSDARYRQRRATNIVAGAVDSDSWERVFQRPDGSPVPVFVHAALVRNADGQPESIACFMQDLTQLREAEKRLQSVVARHEALMAHASDWLLVLDLDGQVLYASPAVSSALGYDVDAVIGRSGWTFAHPDDVRPVAEAMTRVVAEPGRSESVRLRIRHADGRWIWYEEVVTNRLAEPAIRGIVCLGRDITDRVLAEEALRDSEEWFRNIAVTAQEGIWAVDGHGRTLFANAMLGELLGIPLPQLYEQTAAQLLCPDDPERLWLAGLGASTRAEKHEIAYTHPETGTRWLQMSLSVLEHGGQAGWLAMISDVTDIRRIEEELRHRALYDQLTWLPNRTLLLDRLDLALARSRQDPAYGPVSVLLLDLDNFKLVNDTWGHAAGDQLLATIAGRLMLAVRPTDTVARFGGDEFVIVCEGLEEDEVRALADRILAAVGERVEVAGHATYVSASVGIAMSPPDSPDHLVRFADAAMYDAKARGRNRTQLFDVELADAAADRLVLGNDLREALAADALDLHYQPVVQLDTGAVLGVEALARWQHPVRGQVAPGRFVRVAELTGQAPALDAWALARACSDATALRRGLGSDLRIAVNISPANLEGNRLEEQLLAALAGARLPAGALVLEVTENTLMARPEVARAALERLRAHGVSVAIDDFGTGYSSLAYLTQLPVQTMKIDRSFVLALTDDADAFAITAAIVDLGRTLGLRTIAEGVETPEQLALLHKLGCSAAQGFLWSPALPVDELVALLVALPGRRFAVSATASAKAPAGRRRKEPVTVEHGLADLQRMHRDGASLATIASALNASGFRTPQGMRWHRASVARVISDLAYPQLRSGDR
ncbi:MAG: EAL domain-containing protein [Mycobacteriales bacterium]